MSGARRLRHPQRMMVPGPALADVAVQDGMETTGNDRDAHVDVDDDAADRRQRGNGVHQHREVADDLELARDRCREPQRDARDQQRGARDHHQPEELFLPEVEPPGRRHQRILVAQVMPHRLPPLAIAGRRPHVADPGDEHPADRDREHQADPRVQDPRQVAAAEHDGDPVERRCPEGEAREEEIDVGDRREGVHQPLGEGVAQDSAHDPEESTSFRPYRT